MTREEFIKLDPEALHRYLDEQMALADAGNKVLGSCCGTYSEKSTSEQCGNCGKVFDK